MKFVLEVDLDAVAGAPDEGLGRILRYWAGTVKHDDLAPGTVQTIRNTGHAAVGTWRMEDGNA
ncbi:MAG: hypothetical protein ABI563_13760 [Specibacter sp.]